MTEKPLTLNLVDSFGDSYLYQEDSGDLVVNGFYIKKGELPNTPPPSITLVVKYGEELMVARTQTTEGEEPWIEYNGKGILPSPLMPDSQIEIESMGGYKNIGSVKDLDWCGVKYYRLLPKMIQIGIPKDPLLKQERYQDDSGEDWIDEFARTKTVEEFRGAMSFSIGKYNRRLGKKDEVLKEVKKMADYAQRWVQYEEELIDD